MSGRRKWSDIRDENFSTPDAQARLARAQEDLDRELESHSRTLKQLRRARRMTQSQVATQMQVSQAQVSRVESQADLYLSTLRSYVEAMGGELQLRVSFTGGDWTEVAIGEITGLDDEPIHSPRQLSRRAGSPTGQTSLREVHGLQRVTGVESVGLWLLGTHHAPESSPQAGLSEARWWPHSLQRPTNAPGTPVINAYLGEARPAGRAPTATEAGALAWLSLSGDLQIPDDNATFISEAPVRESFPHGD